MSKYILCCQKWEKHKLMSKCEILYLEYVNQYIYIVKNNINLYTIYTDISVFFFTLNWNAHLINKV